MAQDPISPVTTSKPELIISAPAVNDQPAELDGTPTSPERIKLGRRSSKQEEPSAEELEQRAKLISDRKGDKGVLVDIPGTTPLSNKMAHTLGNYDWLTRQQVLPALRNLADLKMPKRRLAKLRRREYATCRVAGGARQRAQWWAYCLDDVRSTLKTRAIHDASF